METTHTVSAAMLTELVRRIVEAVQPRRIILFGSAACGQMGPHSDLDVLVIMPDGIHRRETARQIYRALRRLGMPKDVVVVTESDVERFGNEPSLVIHPALSEGKEIYHAE
ncbi:MAG TPA: nucleotidyltransferase domain-containing protein [Atribacteraceae bacterium]|nr:nucleotidyltransferase domain-containing protein [Atribacteraceae bacterium]